MYLTYNKCIIYNTNRMCNRDMEMEEMREMFTIA